MPCVVVDRVTSCWIPDRAPTSKNNPAQKTEKVTYASAPALTYTNQVAPYPARPEMTKAMRTKDSGGIRRANLVPRELRTHFAPEKSGPFTAQYYPRPPKLSRDSMQPPWRPGWPKQIPPVLERAPGSKINCPVGSRQELHQRCGRCLPLISRTNATNVLSAQIYELSIIQNSFEGR